MEKVPSPTSEADQHQEMADKIKAIQNGNKPNTQETEEKGIPKTAETDSTTTETGSSETQTQTGRTTTEQSTETPDNSGTEKLKEFIREELGKFGKEVENLRKETEAAVDTLLKGAAQGKSFNKETEQETKEMIRKKELKESLEGTGLPVDLLP